jgi:hypothetical protein
MYNQYNQECIANLPKGVFAAGVAAADIAVAVAVVAVAELVAE